MGEAPRAADAGSDPASPNSYWPVTRNEGPGGLDTTNSGRRAATRFPICDWQTRKGVALHPCYNVDRPSDRDPMLAPGQRGLSGSLLGPFAGETVATVGKDACSQMA